MTTIDTVKKLKRRTFREISIEAYSRGWKEGREAGNKSAEEELGRLSAANIKVVRQALELSHKLENMSLRELAWSRIMGIFK